MLEPEIMDLKYTYKKEGEDVWVLNTDDIPVDMSRVKDQQIVHLAPGSKGGNHKHPRTEWFIGIGELFFVWLDESGQTHEEHMHPDGKIRLITVPPFLVHAVINRSADKVGILFELADGKMTNVEAVPVI